MTETMPTETADTTVAVETPKVKKARKPKTAATSTSAPTAAPAKTKNSLRKPQVRILEALAKASAPLTRSDIATKAKVDVATCVEYIGSHDDAKRKANDEKHFPCLISLSLVKFARPEDDASGVSYEISAKGRSTLERLDKAASKAK